MKFSRLVALRNHVKIHNDQTQFELIEHEALHTGTGTRSYICQFVLYRGLVDPV